MCTVNRDAWRVACRLCRASNASPRGRRERDASGRLYRDGRTLHSSSETHGWAIYSSECNGIETECHSRVTKLINTDLLNALSRVKH